jgi:hypothetical protein
MTVSTAHMSLSDNYKLMATKSHGMMHVYCYDDDSVTMYKPDDFGGFNEYLEGIGYTSTFIGFLQYAFVKCGVDFLRLDNSGDVVPGFDTFDW